jgi:hypothetical protein
VDYESNSKSSKSLNWQSMSGSGHSDETIVHTKINAGGDVNINAVQGVVVDIKNGGTVQQSIDKLATQPGLEYLADLKNNPNVDFNKINEAHKNWNYKSQGLTEVGAAMVVIVVTIATAGAGASAMGSMGYATAGTATASTTTVISAGAMAASSAAISAGIANLTSTAVISLANNGGDIGKTLKDLGSSETLKSLSVSMATAGAVAGLSNAAGVSGKFSDLKLADQAKRVVITVGATSTVDSVINGTDLGKNLVDNLKTSLVNAVGANAAAAIGDMNLNAISSAVAHAAVGCAEGAANGGGCTGGAIGAAAGEWVASQYLANSQSNTDKLYQDAFASDNPTGQQEINLITGLTAQMQAAVDTARLAGALAALASGEDAAGINAAANAAAIAAENNATSAMQKAIESIKDGTAKAEFDNLLAKYKYMAKSELADLYLDSDNSIEKAAIYTTMVAQEFIQPGSTVEAIFVLATSSAGGKVIGSAVGAIGKSALTVEEILMPGGKLVGYVAKGAKDTIKTVTKSELEIIESNLMTGARELTPPPTYKGQWYELPNGQGNFGIRNSTTNGKTIDLNIPSIPNINRIHSDPL